MSNFNGMVTPVVPSDAGKDFAVDTHVTFLVHGQPQTGVVTKQLKNAAVVEIDETQKIEKDLILQAWEISPALFYVQNWNTFQFVGNYNAVINAKNPKIIPGTLAKIMDLSRVSPSSPYNP